MKKLCQIFLVVALFAVGQHSALAEHIIRGRIIDGTRDSSAVASIQVHLQKIEKTDVNPAGLQQTRSLSSGNYRFTVQNIDSLSTWFAAVDYQGVRYYSHGTNFKAGTNPLQQDIVVYDSTHSAADVNTLMHHIFIDNLGKTVRFRESFVLNNPGKKAITHAIHNQHIGGATLQFELPQTAVNFAATSSREIIQHGQFVFDKTIMLPGNKQVSYSYEIPWKGNSLPVSFTVDQPSRTFNLFISDPNMTLVSAQLADDGPFSIRGNTYHRYGLDNIAKGTRISFTLRRAGGGQAQSSTRIIILTVVLLGLALVIGYVRKTKKISSIEKIDRTKIAQRKKELILEIARLDLAAAQNDLQETKNKRQSLMDELVGIEMTLKNAAGKTKSRSKK
ncbi:MAG: hypothetical protein GWP06_09330 [Actinobacteria bacterium]|nr:hypothetical protein [Actinomycetota bacterium]